MLMNPDLNFASDNVWGASAPVLRALLDANAGPSSAYGTDPITREIEARFAEMFEQEVSVFLVGTGTAANALALAATLSPWGLCICHEEAHVLEDECGAPEFFSHGAKLLGLAGSGCKLAPRTVAAALEQLPRHEKQMPAQALTLSQATESGTVYFLDEIATLAGLAHEHGLKVHMDGARFANALVRLDASPADMTWRAGIDILSFGATKNGCLAAEAVVVFDQTLADGLAYRRKRAGQTFSKGRLLAAQLRGYLQDDHWLDNARHANAAAARLSAGLARLPGVRIAWPTEVNEVFAILPRPVDSALRKAGASYHPWSTRSLPEGEAIAEDEILVRLVTSFATADGAVERVLHVAAEGRDTSVAKVDIDAM